MTNYRPRKSGSYVKDSEAAEPRLVARTEEAPRAKQAAPASSRRQPSTGSGVTGSEAEAGAPVEAPAADETGVQAPRKKKE